MHPIWDAFLFALLNDNLFQCLNLYKRINRTVESCLLHLSDICFYDFSDYFFRLSCRQCLTAVANFS